jgi:hypothetical protein
MPTSHSIGNHLNFLSLGARAARSYAAMLPREAGEVAERLEVLFDDLRSLNAQQEKAKQQLAMLTREVKALKKKSCQERSRLIRLAEATFGPRDPRIKEFRPATEGKVRTARVPKAVSGAETASVAPPPPTPRRTPGPQEQEPRPRSEPEPRLESQATRPTNDPSPPRPGAPSRARVGDGIAADTAVPRTRAFWWRPWSRRVDRRAGALRWRAGVDRTQAHGAAPPHPKQQP